MFIEAGCETTLASILKISNSWDYTLIDGKTERFVDLCMQAGGSEYISGPAAKGYLYAAIMLARCKKKKLDESLGPTAELRINDSLNVLLEKISDFERWLIQTEINFPCRRLTISHCTLSWLKNMNSMDLRSILAIPIVYRIFTKIIGGSRARVGFVRQYLKPKENDRILDIGCGPGSILEFLPMVDYVGFDSNSDYIEAAKKRFAGRAQFMCMNVSRDAITGSSFDLVLALGILHHL